MKQTPDGKFKVTVGNESNICPDYVSAAEWAESLLYDEGDTDG
jgi:hypothetical protein